jgi:hypothetical protein
LGSSNGSLQGRRASGAHVAVVELPPKLKEKLRALGLAEQRVLGLSTLEILRFASDTATTGAACGSELRVKLISCRLQAVA